MAFFQATKSAVPFLYTVILALCSLFISSHAKSCKCSSANQDLSDRYTTNSTFSKIGGDLFLLNPGTLLPGSLGFYKNNPSKLNLSAPGLFVISDEIDLWVHGNSGEVHKTSFSAVFTMSICQTTVVDGSLSLIFAIIPQVDFYNSIALHRNISYWYPTSIIPYNAPLAGNKVIVQAGAFSWISANDTIVCLNISIEPVVTMAGDTTVNYIISIDYIPLENQMSIQVSVDAEGQPNPESFKAIMPLNDADYASIWPYGLFTFSSSTGQLLKLHDWNLTVERFPEKSGNRGSTTTIILSTVLGSAAATIITAAIVYWYFNSSYRRYKKDLDQLAKSMQLLPGMLMQFNFTDIQKATRNFHETMRLGQGGFGAVYRCRLPLLEKGEMIEVAVKKFSQNDNRGYENLLAEVSIINRLRHKNIVPLIGWSYNKGEPLLIYEYMPNGSLDQHLFHTSGALQQHPTHIHRWDTRYNIVKDIAIGLHYVHHEYEPIVLHRDIKASNIMIDSTFQARLGDFGLACVVAMGRSSYTDIGAPGTLGFRAPEYIHSGKATKSSEVFAFGVLILEIVTGRTAVNMQYSHVTDWVWHLHREDTLLVAVDPRLTTNESEANDAKRLLLLGLACSSPNPSDRPTMVEAVQIITKSAPPPDVPLEKPRFLWPPEEGNSLSSGYSTELTIWESSLATQVEMAAVGQSSCGNEPSRDVSSICHTKQYSLICWCTVYDCF